MTTAFLKNARHEGSVNDICGRASVNESGDRIIRNDADIMHAKLQHPGRYYESDGSRDEIDERSLPFMLDVPTEEEADRDRDHKKDRDDQRGNAAFADDDILKFRHFSSPPQTSTQKLLRPQAVQVSFRAVGV